MHGVVSRQQLGRQGLLPPQCPMPPAVSSTASCLVLLGTLAAHICKGQVLEIASCFTESEPPPV